MSSGREQAIPELIREIGESGRAITDAELERVRAHLATHTLTRPTMAVADDELGGLPWEGRVLKGGEWLDRLAAKYLKHVEIRREWPDGTTLDEYAASLAEAVRDPGAGVYLEWDDGWKLTFAARSQTWRGPFGYPYIVVAFYPEQDFWVTGFQPREGLAHVTHRPTGTGGRWLRRPR